MNEPEASQRAAGRGATIKKFAAGLAAIVAAYLLFAYILLPLFWRTDARLHPALDAAPYITITGDKHPGDPINVALVGAEEELAGAMKAAGWFPADPLGLKSDVKIAADTVLDRPYDEAPVSSLYLFGRKEDLAFEFPVGDSPGKRHHVRFWKADKLDANGRPAWFGSATYDERVGLSHTTGQVTHHIAPDVDAERAFLLEKLQAVGRITSIEWIADFHKAHEGKNGGGDTWRTDGRLPVGDLASASRR